MIKTPVKFNLATGEITERDGAVLCHLPMARMATWESYAPGILSAINDHAKLGKLVDEAVKGFEQICAVDVDTPKCLSLTETNRALSEMVAIAGTRLKALRDGVAEKPDGH